MDPDSLGSLAIFDALIGAVRRLDEFGYELYLKHAAPGRTPAGSLAVSGSSFRIHRKDGTSERFDGAFILGCSVHQDGARHSVIIFTLILCWTRQEWLVQAWVEEEDSRRENMTLDLTDPTEFRASTVSGVVEALKLATDSLEQSVTLPAVATRLNAIQSRNA